MRKPLCALFLLLFPAGSSAASPAALEAIRERQFSLQAPVDTVDVTAPAAALPVDVSVPTRPTEDRSFNSYVLKAVDWLYANYGRRGYDIKSILTHDIEYHDQGFIPARNPPLTMCVAAQMEVILTAYRLYAQETGDYSVYDYLPKRSFEGLSVSDLKGHIWVNHAPEFDSWGTADALIHFGMGERTAFRDLKPGGFVNINRDNATGHAVTFIGFIDRHGDIQSEYNPNVAGFKYFSSQYGDDYSGLGYGNAVFRQHGCPDIPDKDCGVLDSADQHYLNTGTMLSPRFWRHPDGAAVASYPPDTVLDEHYFNGVTPDRINPDY
ncbi:MAG TPA: hypothetical protein PL037_02775 [Elusimicrobiales bacterium]|nr:hypothetical protein [Elusimicrobiales bacterium]